MKIQDIFILIIVLVLFGNNNIKQEFSRPLLAYESEIAYKVLDTDFDIDGITPEKLCSCNGTGKIKSGDGILDLPCPCGDNCKCVPSQDISSFSHRYMFTISNCSYCEIFKKNDIPILLNSNWVIAYDKLAKNENLVIVDVEKHPDIYKLYAGENDTFPFYVVVKNKKMVDSKHGYMNAVNFADWSNYAIRNN